MHNTIRHREEHSISKIPLLSFRYSELKQTLKQHKRRNITTGFGIAWGISILILLLAAGEGLQKGIERIFSDYAQNSMWVYGGKTSMIQDGNIENKPIVFSQSLLNSIRRKYDEIKYISPEITKPGSSLIYYQDQNQLASVKGVNAHYFDIKLLKLAVGRRFDPIDVQSKRPVCIIGNSIKKVLFHNKAAVGQYVNISGTWFKVVGVLAKGSAFNQGQQRAVFVTYGSFEESFSHDAQTTVFGVLLTRGTNAQRFEKKLKTFLSDRLDFNPQDKKALYVMNFNEQVKSFDELFMGVKIFLWFIGVCLLLSGIIGVGNMMSFVVKERTREIGIRRAIGATPGEILAMILLESIVITAVSGIVGMLASYGLISIINVLIHFLNHSNEALIHSLQVNVPVTLSAMALLIVAGCAAGMVPAKHATEIVPLEGLNKEF